MHGQTIDRQQLAENRVAAGTRCAKGKLAVKSLTLPDASERRSLVNAAVVMKTRILLFLACTHFGATMGSVAHAQATNPPVPIDRPSAGQPAIAERPTVIPLETTRSGNGPARPELPGQTAPSSELRDLVKDFQTARAAYLKQQQELLAQLKAASKEERDALRQQLRENLDVWLEQQKAQIQDIREQAREIKNNVPSIRDVVESGGGEGRNR